MKKSMKLVISTLALALSFTTAIAAPNSDAEIVKNTITALMQEHKIPGVAVELYVDGKPEAYFFGYANTAKQEPITDKTIFEVGSISKVMTSILLAQQVDSGKLQLDDSITTVLPELPTAFDDISFKNLATHTSGLPFSAPATVKNRKELETYFKTWEPTADADEEWTYSNFGIGMLGEGLEAFTHQNFNQLYRKNILLPLKMQPIGLTVPANLMKYYAQGYDKNGLATKPIQSGLFPAAGGMKMSASDMQHFLKAAIGLSGTPDRIFYPMRMTQAAYVKLEDKMQGLGWQIHSLDPDEIAGLLAEGSSDKFGPFPVVEMMEKPKFDGDSLIDKTGTTDGFRAYVAVIPSKKTGIVILMNKNIDNGPLVDAARGILFKINKIEPKPKEENHQDA